MKYLLFLSFLLCLVYTFLLYFFPYFFGQKPEKRSAKSTVSYLIILVLSLAGYWVSYSIPDPVIGNRFLHAFGGGFMAFLVCFLAFRDAGVKAGRFRFFVLSALIVTALGVGNEILEFALQYFSVMISANSINDTWLDLISNTTGVLIGAACLVPFIEKRNPEALR